MKGLSKRVIEGLFSEHLSGGCWFSVEKLRKLYCERVQTSIKHSSFLEGLNAFQDQIEVIEGSEHVCRLLDSRFCRGHLKNCMGGLSEKDLANLAKVVAEEDWSIPGKPDIPYALLRNYLVQVFKRAYYENKIFASEWFLIFNTGLYDNDRENVYYGLLERSENAGGTPYSFYAWRPEKHIPEWKGELPKAVDFLDSLQPHNPNYQHTPDFSHIFNKRPRLDFFGTESREILIKLLDGCIQAAIRRAKARDFSAVPTYFPSENRVDLLIPLYYNNIPQAAFVLNIKQNRYEIKTVLTLEMAYQNARVITNVSNTWIGEVFSQNNKLIMEESSQTQTLREKAKKGDAEAWFQLGNIYDIGDGVAVNLEKAFSCYQKAGEAGLGKAWSQIGLCYLYARGVKRDNDKARRAFVVGSIYYGDADSQYQLARLLLQFPQVKMHEQAYNWVKKAKEQGHRGASILLGEMYCYGWGRHKDAKTGVRILKEAAKQGDKKALRSLGVFYWESEDYQNSIPYLVEIAGEYTDVKALLAFAYYTGRGVDKNLALATQYVEEVLAEDKEDATANFVKFKILGKKEKTRDNMSQMEECARLALGHRMPSILIEVADYFSNEKLEHMACFNDAEVLYRQGQHLEANLDRFKKPEELKKQYREIMKCYRKAAKQGHINAKIRRGELFLEGRYGNLSYKKAELCFSSAAKLGDDRAQRLLGEMYCFNERFLGKEEEGFRLLLGAVEKHNVDALALVGRCYFEGVGVGVSYVKALEYFERAAKNKNCLAQYYLGECHFNGIGVSQSCEDAAKWYRKAAYQGLACAQRMLGICYANGFGVEVDYDEALKWGRKADKNGAHGALVDIVNIFKTKESQEDGDLLHILGRCHMNGEGVAESREIARIYFEKAERLGNLKSQNVLRASFL